MKGTKFGIGGGSHSRTDKSGEENLTSLSVRVKTGEAVSRLAMTPIFEAERSKSFRTPKVGGPRSKRHQSLSSLVCIES